MKLSELMATHTPSSTFEGFVTNDDFCPRDRLLRGRLRYG